MSVVVAARSAEAAEELEATFILTCRFAGRGFGIVTAIDESSKYCTIVQLYIERISFQINKFDLKLISNQNFSNSKEYSKIYKVYEDIRIE